MGTVPEECKKKMEHSLFFRTERGRKWQQPTIGGSKRKPSCPKLHLGARRIPKGVTNYSVMSCSKMPMLAVIRATYVVRSSPVGLNVTRHFTIARTQQRLLIQIMNESFERHFSVSTKQAIPRKLNLFSHYISLQSYKSV
jgi:hypothetical protein